MSDELRECERQSRESWLRMDTMIKDIERVAQGGIRPGDYLLIMSVFCHMAGELTMRKVRRESN